MKDRQQAVSRFLVGVWSASFSCVHKFSPERLRSYGTVEVEFCGHRMWYTAAETMKKIDFRDFIRLL